MELFHSQSGSDAIQQRQWRGHARRTLVLRSKALFVSLFFLFFSFVRLLLVKRAEMSSIVKTTYCLVSVVFVIIIRTGSSCFSLVSSQINRMNTITNCVQDQLSRITHLPNDLVDCC